MPKPADVRAALQRVAAAIHSLLSGTADPLVYEVTTRDLHRLRRALKESGLFKSTVAGRGGRGGGGLNGDSTTVGAVTQGSKTGKENGTPREAKREAEKAARITWLTPACLAYEAAYHEKPSPVTISRMARVFSQLEEAHPRGEVQRRYGNYVRNTPIRFYSIDHFGDTWPRWATAQSDDPTALRPGETLDQYAARLAAQ